MLANVPRLGTAMNLSDCMESNDQTLCLKEVQIRCNVSGPLYYATPPVQGTVFEKDGKTRCTSLVIAQSDCFALNDRSNKIFMTVTSGTVEREFVCIVQSQVQDTDERFTFG